MMERIAEASPRFKAGVAGAFQLLAALTATFGQVIIRAASVGYASPISEIILK